MNSKAALSPQLSAPNQGETIHAVGVQMTFKTTGKDSDGQWLAVEYTAPPNFAGPPPHWHKITTEIFYVLEGNLTLNVDENTLQTGPGGLAFVPPGAVHSFSNQSSSPTQFLLVTSPAGLENYFSELTELVKQEPQWPPQDMGKVFTLMAKYDTFPTKG